MPLSLAYAGAAACGTIPFMNVLHAVRARRFSLWVLGLLLCATAAAAPVLRVEVEGLAGELRDNVFALLTVHRERAAEGLSEARIRRYFQRGPDEIRQALVPFGHYAPRIESELEQTRDGWLARFRVDPGEPVRFGVVDVRVTGAGSAAPELADAAAKLGIRPGQPARHAVYEQAKSELQRLALEQGYLEAAYRRHELRIDVAAGSADVHLELDTGPQFRFGEVEFDYAGLDPGLVRRYLPFQPGDPYSNRRLLELQRALEDSDYFARVEVLPQREQVQDNVVPVKVALEARKRHKYTAGLGFGTDTGARGLLGWEHRRINRHGHRLKADLRLSEIRQDLTANYSLPLAEPRTDRLDFTAAATEEETDAVDFSRQKLGVARGVARGRWREVLSLSYEREDYRVGLTDETTTLLVPGIGYSQVRADNRLIARRGRRLQYDLRGAAEPLLSDTSFVQAEVKAKWIRSMGERGRWLLRAEAGSTWTADFDLLPASRRYFAGGDQSVRGYDFQELGPRDASGEVIGGRHFVFGSVEYEHRIVGNWGVALFVDSGNAFNDYGDGVETGAGIGLRWASPIGMVRVDVASAVSDDRSLRLHFTLGPDL